MNLMDLPQEVLTHVMSLTDQPGRCNSLVTCKGLSAAALDPANWQEVSFGDLDPTAAEFVVRQGCTTVSLYGSEPDDASWFLHRLADEGYEGLRHLVIEFDTIHRLPCDLLVGIARHGQLRTVDIRVLDMECTCELHFPKHTRMLHLETLRVVETSEECKQMVVWFGGTQSGFPALHTLHLDVGLSDVLEGVRNFPRLKHLTYLSDDGDAGETYEDARLEGCDLDSLSLDIYADSDTRHLARELEKAAVRRLVLHLHDEHLDLRYPLSPALKQLHLVHHVDHSGVMLDYPFVRQSNLRRIVSDVSENWRDFEEHCSHFLTMHHVGNVPEAMQHLSTLDVRLGISSRLCLCPV